MLRDASLRDAPQHEGLDAPVECRMSEAITPERVQELVTRGPYHQWLEHRRRP
jgi:hypothetical protein